MTKSRIFLFLLLAFIIGVAIRSFISLPIGFIWLGSVVAVIAVAFGILRKQKVVILGGFLFLVVLAGIFRFDQHEAARPDLSGFYGKPLVLRGVVIEEPERRDSNQHLKIEVETVNAARIKPSFYTLITTRRYPEYKIGDDLELQGFLQQPKNYSDFDYVSYLAKEDIFSTLYFPLIEKVGEEKGNKLTILLAKTKRAFEEKIDSVFPEPHAAFLKGLLLGEKESLPKDLVEDFKKSGTSHIVALSGYNITIVARFFVDLLMFLTVPFVFSFWIAILAITLFVVMVGASASVVRAGIMGILVLIAQREGRAYHMTNALAFAAALMIFQNPEILRFDAAFQLSFLAAVGLVYLSPRVERVFYRFYSKLSLGRNNFSLGQKDKDKVVERHKLFPLKRILVETLSAQIMVLPLLVYLFGRVSLVSPLSNLLVLAAVPYTMALGFLSGISGFIWLPLSQIISWPTWLLLEYKLLIIRFFAGLPVASLNLGYWSLIPVLIIYCFAFLKIWQNKN